MTSAPAHAAARPDTAAAPLPARTGRTRPGPATRQTSLILGPLATAPGTARGTLSTALILWGLAHLTDDGGQITSELVTNAITASRAAAPPGTEPRPLTLWITARNQELCIRVWDPDPDPPPLHQPPPGPLTEHGRGLLIVSALSHQWGWHPAPYGGKYVWATLCTPAGDTPAATDAATRADRARQDTP
jgi:anti-sigma regulatory factor (Ser/Thr protein kinase)